MKQRDLFYDKEAAKKLKRGVDALADMVKVTLGPKGNNVIIERNTGPLITKDGVTVAREIFLEDPVENMGAQLVKEVASKTNETAGDGTTTATVLAQALISEGIQKVLKGANPIDLKRGMDIAVKEISRELKQIGTQVQNKEEIINVASISANNDYEVGNFIAEAIDKAGNEGIVIVEDAKGVESVIDMVEGMQFDRGYKFSAFINKKSTMEVELQNTYILLYNGTLQQLPAVASLMKQVYEKGNSSLLIVADEFSDEINKLLLLNSSTVKGNLSCCTVMSPGYGDRRVDLLNDIAAFTGGIVYGSDLYPITQASLSTLGKADKILIDKNRTVIIGGKGSVEAVKERIEQIRYLLNNTTIDFDRQKLQERLGKLTGGIVVLKVGAVTETELKEKKMRIEDALHATRAALEEGIVPGGGTALIRARKVLKNPGNFAFVRGNTLDQKLGIDIVYKALEIPFLSICNNAGLQKEVKISRKLRKVWWKLWNKTILTSEEMLKIVENNSIVSFGYDALNDTLGNLLKLGVIDPTKVVRLALENAVSVAGMFLITKGTISQSKKEKEYFDKMLSQPAGY